MARTHRLAALWAVALGVGLRRGEALGLKWSDVDLDRGRLTVRRSLQHVDGKLTLHQTKTSTSERTIPLAQPLIRALHARSTCGLFACVQDVWSPNGPQWLHSDLSRRAAALMAPVSADFRVDHSAQPPGADCASAVGLSAVDLGRRQRFWFCFPDGLAVVLLLNHSCVIRYHVVTVADGSRRSVDNQDKCAGNAVACPVSGSRRSTRGRHCPDRTAL